MRVIVVMVIVVRVIVVRVIVVRVIVVRVIVVRVIVVRVIVVRVIVVMVIHSHCWYMFSREAVRGIADQHAGLTYCTISHYHTLDTLHLVRL